MQLSGCTFPSQSEPLRSVCHLKITNPFRDSKLSRKAFMGAYYAMFLGAFIAGPRPCALQPQTPFFS